MSLIVSTKAEFLKSRRTASFWVAILGAGFIPLIFFLSYVFKPEHTIKRMGEMPWEMHFMHGWQAFAAFLLPMFVILICTQIPQIEYRNNTWKQVLSSPQTIRNIFLSKLIAILRMVLLMLLMFNLFMLLAGAVANWIIPRLNFLEKRVDWTFLIRLNFKTLVALLAIISLQYWLGLRFRNFIVAIGIGLAMLITTMLIMSWEHVYKFPYAFPFLTFSNTNPSAASARLLENHELNSIGYFFTFTLLGFWDMRRRKGWS